MRKLSTWLVVALTGGAFALGLTGGAFLAGGAHRNNLAPKLSPPATTGSAALGSTPPHATASQKAAVPSTRTPPSGSPKAAVRTVTRPAVDSPVAVATPNPKRVIVSVPEPNPVAAATPTAVPVAVGAPPPPAAPPAQPTAPPATPPQVPAKGESTARRAMANGGVNLLQEAAAEGGGATASLKIVQELEKCLELVAASSLPGGLEPPPCELK
jgi:hypothetical protein